jgi:hypothetical protein
MPEEELIPLPELAELAGRSPYDTAWAVQRCSAQRVNFVTKYREQQPLLYLRAADVPCFLGLYHPITRGGDWRLELSLQRRRKTRALKARVARVSREARLQEHLRRMELEVEQALARAQRSTWRRA